METTAMQLSNWIFRSGNAPNGGTNSVALIVITDEAYAQLRSRMSKPRGVVEVRAGDSAAPFMVLRSRSGSPICGIATSQEDRLGSRRCEAAVIRPVSHAAQSLTEGSVQVMHSGICADMTLS
ncbi:hypothetical protein [Nocardia sp. CA-120079]|uniref:hypothetical protein n=1 Tax=Nocardia sp. CA-120079 TaxID=3239974 RepID=UPI003D99B2A8